LLDGLFRFDLGRYPVRHSTPHPENPLSGLPLLRSQLSHRQSNASNNRVLQQFARQLFVYHAPPFDQ
jgi:hypothetical protein